MTVIEQLNAEIERLKAKYRKDMYKSNHEGLASVYKIEAYNELLSFISTLESEKPMVQDEDLDKEIKRYIDEYYKEDCIVLIAHVARHFAEWGAEHLKK